MDDLLAGAALVYFDGRLTEAALVVARRARQLGVPVRGGTGHHGMLQHDCMSACSLLVQVCGLPPVPLQCEWR